MKSVAFAVACLFAAGLVNAETRVSLGAVSYHAAAEEPLRGVHPGFAVDVVNNGAYLQAGGYLNSVNRPMYFAATGRRVGVLRAGLVAVRYVRKDHSVYAAVLPHLMFAWRGVYTFIVPPFDDVQPYTTFVLTYGFRVF